MHGADFHNTLRNFFLPPVLPPEYGGEGAGIEKACQDWTNQLIQSEKLLQQIAAHPTGDISEDVQTEQLSEGWSHTHADTHTHTHTHTVLTHLWSMSMSAPIKETLKVMFVQSMMQVSTATWQPCLGSLTVQVVGSMRETVCEAFNTGLMFSCC